ncbi:MAG: glycosyl transferase [Oscillospiraceae bacterium]|jgi:mannosyltransferase OCH1-like enzyme|nr:glycosyl transferase [Oscillospiraceae bacterium]
MIPKIIHYCWFGGKPKPKLVQRCMASWATYAPGFALREWNERNFDVNALPFTRDAALAGNYAFVSDVARAKALYVQGGVYLDTDTELLRPLDALLGEKLFAGFEAGGFIGTALLGSEPGHPIWAAYLAQYENEQFAAYKGTNVQLLTTLLEARGLARADSHQQLPDVRIYPSDWFSPYDYRSAKLHLSENSMAIHHFSGSWFPWHVRVRPQIKKVLRKFI